MTDASIPSSHAREGQNRPPAPLPLSVLTGFLGAGKTMLLNRLL
jgi:predicted ATPase